MQVTTTKSRTVGKFVDSKHTDNVIRNYKQERWVQNSKHIGKEDSLSAWYSGRIRAFSGYHKRTWC
ncbi:MAG: hypothetical protein IPP79_13430 [Chitinophagaceae bacterium]|nr:hypothetical protein [Chitinophagaceae bacterium]